MYITALLHTENLKYVSILFPTYSYLLEHSKSSSKPSICLGERSNFVAHFVLQSQIFLIQLETKRLFGASPIIKHHATRPTHTNEMISKF